MNPVFADTSFYIAYSNPADPYHQKAFELSDVTRTKVTTEFVLLELASAFARQPARRKFIAFMREMYLDPDTRVVPVSRRLYREGLRLYVARRDKEWSLVDCISFEVMRRQGLTDALTTDRHFQQAGFRALLLEP